MNLYKMCLILYGLNGLSVTLHELAHLLTAKLVFGAYDELSIGNLIYPVSFQKLKLSPIIFSGYVSVEQETVLTASYKKIILFFLSGPITTLIIGTICYLAVGTLLFRIIGLYNLIIGIMFLLPLPGTDMYHLMKVLHYKHLHEK